MKKKLNVTYWMAILIILWLVFSYVDVITHNMATQTYAWWNAFYISLKLYFK